MIHNHLRCSIRRTHQDHHPYRTKKGFSRRLHAASNNMDKSSSDDDTTIRSNGDDNDTTITDEFPSWLNEVDVQTNQRTPLQYDPTEERFIAIEPTHQIQRKRITVMSLLKPMLSSAFIPEGVNESYFQYMRWRCLQRFVNANLHVIGTQSLLLGLGIKSSSKLGVSAALNWVLKDALGKMARMLWASQMGRRFDSDAKRWRFRASLLFAVGNFLEILTYMMPQLFLLWATLANCCKQIAMLTSSSTRTSLYNSFRDGTRENIGDITAKGEAQIAIVDLMGIASGVFLAKSVVGTAVSSVVLTYLGLQFMEIFSMYHEIRSVQFRVLNFERLEQIIRNFVRAQPESFLVPSLPTAPAKIKVNGGASGAITMKHEKKSSNKAEAVESSVPTPEAISNNERIFWPPKHLSRRALAFGSLGRAKLSGQELERLLQIFESERFLLVIGPNMKKPKLRSLFFSKPSIQEYCHIVLHEDASNADIVKSTLALTILREKLLLLQSKRSQDDDDESSCWEDEIRSQQCWDILEATQRECKQLFPQFLRELSSRKWSPPSRFMFGRVKKRAQWPLKPMAKPLSSSSSSSSS
ncbi:unnamed protein product [Cylindrotheca closterium]|uniref:Uncharacterized protein n=1 Tax=Cylindrotheca closterium TaxID=2856 RepID=A0AAD2GAC9_9STRA|nr:unnamed protein product [Cylindrotheca closterium]